VKCASNQVPATARHGIRRQTFGDSHTYCALSSVRCHALTAWWLPSAPAWMLVPWVSTSVVASESMITGQPGLAASNRSAAMIIETWSVTTQAPGGIMLVILVLAGGRCSCATSVSWRIAAAARTVATSPTASGRSIACIACSRPASPDSATPATMASHGAGKSG
jgi:hypothetical protein